MTEEEAKILEFTVKQELTGLIESICVCLGTFIESHKMYIETKVKEDKTKAKR